MQASAISGFPLLRAVATILLWLVAPALLLATLAVAVYWSIFGTLQRDHYEGLTGRRRAVAEAMLDGDPFCSRFTATVRFTDVTGTRLAWTCRYRNGGGTAQHAGSAMCDGGRWRAPRLAPTRRDGPEDAGWVVGPARVSGGQRAQRAP